MVRTLYAPQRPCGASWTTLNSSAELCVGVDVEAEPLGLEVLRPIHVADGHDDYLEGHLHA